jgi:YidC/Oxa1 family membrane protein insertase
MGKRAVIFLVISLLIMLVYPFVIEKFLIKGQRKVDGKKEEAFVRSPEPETKVQELQPASPSNQTIEEKEIIVETDLMRVKLSNIGGVIKRWELKKYTLPDGSRIELLPQGKQGIAPLSIYMEDQQGQRAVEGPFEVFGGDLRLSRDR